MKYVDSLEYLDKLKHYVDTFGQNVENTSIVPKVEQNEDIDESNIELDDNHEYSLSRNVKLEERDDGRSETRLTGEN